MGGGASKGTLPRNARTRASLCTHPGNDNRASEGRPFPVTLTFIQHFPFSLGCHSAQDYLYPTPGPSRQAPFQQPARHTSFPSPHIPLPKTLLPSFHKGVFFVESSSLTPLVNRIKPHCPSLTDNSLCGVAGAVPFLNHISYWFQLLLSASLLTALASPGRPHAPRSRLPKLHPPVLVNPHLSPLPHPFSALLCAWRGWCPQATSLGPPADHRGHQRQESRGQVFSNCLRLQCGHFGWTGPPFPAPSSRWAHNPTSSPCRGGNGSPLYLALGFPCRWLVLSASLKHFPHRTLLNPSCRCLFYPACNAIFAASFQTPPPPTNFLSRCSCEGWLSSHHSPAPSLDSSPRWSVTVFKAFDINELISSSRQP